MQTFGVGHKGLCAPIDAQVADQVHGQKEEKQQAGYGHQLFFPDRSAESANNPGHYCFPFQACFGERKREN